MIPVGLFLWTAVIKPLLAWFRGEKPAAVKEGAAADKEKAAADKEKAAVKDKTEDKTPPEDTSDTTNQGESLR